MQRFRYFQFVLCFLICCCSSCISSSKQKKDTVIFINKNYRELGLKEYGRDSVKLARPLPIIQDVYTAEYHLSGQELVIYKVKVYKDSISKEEQFTALLSKKQKLRFKDAIDKIDADAIKQISTNAYAADGFDVDVIVQKNGEVTKLNWSNTYVPEFINLLTIVNQLSPQKYKFYDDEEQFIEFLKRITQESFTGSITN